MSQSLDTLNSTTYVYLCNKTIQPTYDSIYTLDTEHVPLFISVYALRTLLFIEISLAGTAKTQGYCINHGQQQQNKTDQELQPHQRIY